MTGMKRGAIIVIAVVAVLAIVVGALFWWRTMTPDGDRHAIGVTTSSSAGTSDGTPKVSVTNITSPMDYDNDGVDDYTDIVGGARAEAKRHPTYDDGYYQGGYPPADRGACTDLVWRAFRDAGYDLKAMVDADISANRSHYPAITKPDPNIDFRRSGTLDAFFSVYGQTLTTDIRPGDTDNLSQWQPGDIVVFDHDRHIGIVSDRRNDQGVPYILHNNHQKGSMEEDYLSRTKRRAVTGHYRFDASRIPQDVLKAWRG